MSRPRPRILMDCDPGHDDAFALLFAAEACEVVAITTVSGNVDVAHTTRNALIVRDFMGSSTPVHRGADRPLVAEPLHAANIHGESGLDGPVLAAPRGDADALPAAEAILDASRHHEDLWLVATGPLTNLALALRLDPGLATRIAGISLMGGSRTFGNTTAAAEFNILADAEAADVVFRCGARIVMAGLDTTHQWRLDADVVASLRGLKNDVGEFTGDLLEYFLNANVLEGGPYSVPMHDPCAVLALTDPHLFERKAFDVTVELRGEHTRGMTLCDARETAPPEAVNAEVLTRIDGPAATERLLSVLAAYPAAR